MLGDGAPQVCFDARRRTRARTRARSGRRRRFHRRAPGVDEILSQPRSCVREDLRGSVAA